MALLEQTWGPILQNPSYDIVPKAGHWLGRILEIRTVALVTPGTALTAT